MRKKREKSENITERNRAEEALKERKEIFSEVFHMSPIGLSITRIADGQYIDVNEAFLSLFGYEREEALSHTSLQLQTWASSEERDRMVKILQEQGRMQNIEAQYRRKSGEIFTALVSAELIDVGGERYSLSILQDITERKRAEDALRESESKFKRLYDSNIIGVIFWDTSGNISQANDEFLRIVGYTQEDVLSGKVRWKDMTPPEYASLDEIALKEMAETGVSTPFEKEYICKDGSRVPVVIGAVIFKEQKDVGICYIQDISERKKAEEELRELERRFRALFDNTPDGIVLANPENKKFTIGNEAFYQMLGYNSDEIQNLGVVDIHPVEEVNHSVDQFEKLLRKEIAVSENIPVKRKDGSIFFADIRAFLVSLAGKTYLAGIFRDITERKKKEAELAMAQQLYRELFENVTVGILRTTPGPEGTFIDINPAMVNMFEADSREQLMALHPSDIYWDASQRKIISDAIVAKGFAKEEIKFRTLKGKLLLCHINSIKKTDANGKVYFDSTIEDITERKRAEEETANAKAFLESSLEYIPDGVLLLDKQAKFIYVNPTFLSWLGRKAEDFLGKTVREISPPFLTPSTTKTIAERSEKRVKTGEPIAGVDVDLIGKGGEPIPISYSAAGIRNIRGDIIGEVVFIKDITERKQAEQRLKKIMDELAQSNRELEQFAYVASHDLQEPLRMVSSYTQLLAERYEAQLDEKAKKYIHYAVDGAIRMQRLIGDLLTYSRVGTRGTSLEPTDSHAVLGEAIRNLAAAIEENRAIITNDDLPNVRADASQLVQVFQNLLANAIKFHRNDIPRVYVSAQEKGDEWVFSVKDNGVGIDLQYKNKLFVIFQRLHTKKEYPGTGIGLALCKRIVMRHGGTIWFESEPEKGSTFFFTLPK